MSAWVPRDRAGLERHCPAVQPQARAWTRQNHPVAVGYPRGVGVGTAMPVGREALPFGKGEIRRKPHAQVPPEAHRIAILAFGSLLYPALQAAEKLNATVVNMRWAKPLDVELLLKVAAEHDALVTVEDAAVMGGAGSAVTEALQIAGVLKPVLQLGLPDIFIEHGDPAKLMAMHGLDAAGIQSSIEKCFPAHVEQARPALKVVA